MQDTMYGEKEVNLNQEPFNLQKSVLEAQKAFSRNFLN